MRSLSTPLLSHVKIRIQVRRKSEKAVFHDAAMCEQSVRIKADMWAELRHETRICRWW